MKSLKNHISVILSLFILLFSLQFSIVMHKIMLEQNRKLIDNYSIIVVSQTKLKTEDLKKDIREISGLSIISPKKIVDKLKNSMTSSNLATLKIALPYFYSVKLNKFPNQKRLKEIKKLLLSSKTITRVETFVKTYENIYQILQILQIITFSFSAIIAFMSLLLLFKQIRIWILEHEEKIKIMGYFGANYWLKSAFLYKLVFIDSLVSTFFVSAIFVYLSTSATIQEKLSSLNTVFPPYDIATDTGMLFGVSLLLSLFIVVIVSKKLNKS